MLLPHQWTVLTVEEAKEIISFIKTATATKTVSCNYNKMQKLGILDIYNKLQGFVEHYNRQENLLNLDLREF